MTSAPAEFLHARRHALAPAVQAAGVDALVIAHRANIAYLTSFFGTAGLLVALPEELHLISDSRYGEALRERAAALPWLTASVVAPGSTVDETLIDLLARSGVRRIGIEGDAVTLRQHLDWTARLATAAPGAEWQPVDGTVERLRIRKDAWETATLREAGRRLSDVAKCIIPKALAGLAERELAAEIEWELRRTGFDKPAFDTIVASGPNAAVPHHRPGDRVLADGDLVVIDFGGMFRGYAVDMTRTVVIGPAWTARQRTCWQAVWEAQQAAFAAVAPGVPGDDVDDVARRSLEAAGLAEAFGHGLGHGLGLEVHEQPRLARRRPGVSLGALETGMVFTLEPGVYFPGWGGIRIEDDVWLAEAGPTWLTEPIEA